MSSLPYSFYLALKFKILKFFFHGFFYLIGAFNNSANNLSHLSCPLCDAMLLFTEGRVVIEETGILEIYFAVKPSSEHIIAYIKWFTETYTLVSTCQFCLIHGNNPRKVFWFLHRGYTYRSVTLRFFWLSELLHSHSLANVASSFRFLTFSVVKP